MLYKYQIVQDVIVEANTKEEADKLLATENYKVVYHDRLYKGVCNEKGKVYPFVSNLSNGNTCYYESACPYGYSDCILDPAKSEARSCDKEFLDKEVEPCEYYEESYKDYCMYYDDECK